MAPHSLTRWMDKPTITSRLEKFCKSVPSGIKYYYMQVYLVNQQAYVYKTACYI